MNGIHYIRDIMIDRLAGNPLDGTDGCGEHHQFARDSEQRRFRRMAENRKRQILERMLLDDQPTDAQMRLSDQSNRGPHD